MFNFGKSRAQREQERKIAQKIAQNQLNAISAIILPASASSMRISAAEPCSSSSAVSTSSRSGA